MRNETGTKLKWKWEANEIIRVNPHQSGTRNSHRVQGNKNDRGQKEQRKEKSEEEDDEVERGDGERETNKENFPRGESQLYTSLSAADNLR